MEKKKIWNILKTLLKISITGLSLYLVSRKVEFNDLKDAFDTSNPIFLFLAFIAFVISQLISSSRLNTFFKGIGLKISETYNFKIYLLGMFYNLFLPGGIGGDGYKIFLLRKKFEIKGRRLFQAIFFDRLSGLWALGLIISALVIFIPYLGIPNWVPILVVGIGTPAYFVVMRRFFSDYSKQFVLSHIKALMVQSMQVISVILLLYALNFEGKFSPYLFMFLISSLVAIFPFTVGGLGARELVFVYGAQFFQMDQHLAVIISLLFYCISALLSFSGIYFVFHPQKIGVNKIDLKQDIEIEK
ncbi:MAG: lysylphosphatidylglycerol synthase transmembrane domain-containing protein [Daejeonella sp.]|uniref:lysylphosphatidylglycerol synthase transmembrane domain-containing protein n=1 Tax=Daejeonella sp. TaxID=2805397 RepID=UPI002733DC0D|nr:lysylphosphatidylglycerol synthase transmembrane domain-containing protein [Daejeonella sp.]MDP3469071.1 lysylphosphatidylglycerol synthase transmembrane domain-containing protein [Daejeonella sp.]